MKVLELMGKKQLKLGLSFRSKLTLLLLVGLGTAKMVVGSEGFHKPAKKHNHFFPEVVENQIFVVAENAAFGSIIGTIAFSGSDDRGEINWQIISNPDHNENNKPALSINSTTGELLVNDPEEFDFEIESSFIISVIPGKTADDIDPTEVTIQIENVNEYSPQAVADEPIALDEDEPIIITRSHLLGNDFDNDGDSLFVVISTPPAHGEARSESDGSLSYVPTSNFFGTDSLAYKASDAEFTSNEIWIRLNIAPINDPPINTRLTVNSIRENIIPGSKIGELSSEDVEGDRIVNHELVPNPYFELDGNLLKSKVVYNFEEQPSISLLVKVTDERGASGENEVIVEILDHYEAPLLFIPNLFTPNGDNHNDIFRIRGDEIKEISWIIYNHYGEVVFKTSNPATATGKGWNGFYNGIYAPTGTYTWQLQGTFLDGSPLHFKGTNTGQVTLIR